MDALAAEPLDDLLAPLAQADAVLGERRVRVGDPDDVPDRRIRIEAE
jgi:hypothetical protein